MSWTIYHNPRCQKSRQTLELLQKKKITPTIIEYLKEPPTKKQLSEILEKLGMKPSQLIRKKEDKVKQLKLDLSNESKVLDAMAKFPELIERPIVIHRDQAVLGRPPENVLRLI